MIPVPASRRTAVAQTRKYVPDMAWDKVGSGRFSNGDSYLVERHVIYFGVPKSTSVLPFRLRSYRWRLVKQDGTATVQTQAKSRDEVEAAVAAHAAEGAL